MNIQREKFYSQRRRVLKGEDLTADIYYMIEREMDRIIKSYISPGQNPQEYIYEDLQGMIKEVHSLVPQLSYLEVNDIQGLSYESIFEKFKKLAIDAYREHEEETISFYNSIQEQYETGYTPEEPFSHTNVMRNIEKDILLRVVDNKWIDHLHNIDMLRDGIGLRAYGQKDPLIEYKREAYDLFNNMMYEIQSETVKYLFRTRFGVQIVNRRDDDVIQTQLSQAAQEFKAPSEYEEETVHSPVHRGDKIGRNDLCPCGSGKKYKNCCGKNK